MKILLNRRNFLGMLGTFPLLTKIGFSQEINEEEIVPNEILPAIIMPQKLVVPPILKKGDTVAFITPASPTTIGKISGYIKYFKEKGCEIVIGDTITKQNNNHRYLSETDEIRAKEFNKFIADEKIKAIICGRGGYGCMRILRLLDYEILKRNPKIVMGYSDITALLLAIYRQTGITTYHGPVACSKLTSEHKQILEQVFFLEKDTIEYKVPSIKIMFMPDDRQIKGKLQGGNLSLVQTSLGTPYSIDLTDSLFFLEDTNEFAHSFDRMLAAMLNAGQLEKCNAILVGKIKNFNQRGNFHPNKAFTINEIIEQYAKKLNVPCFYNFSFGHVESQYIFPIGMQAKLDLKTKTITIAKK